MSTGAKSTTVTEFSIKKKKTSMKPGTAMIILRIILTTAKKMPTNTFSLYAHTSMTDSALKQKLETLF